MIEYEDTAFALEYDTFDLCGGHATTEGSYHYHGTPGCLQEQASVADGTSADEHSAQLGWAYVRYLRDVNQRQMSDMNRKMNNYGGYFTCVWLRQLSPIGGHDVRPEIEGDAILMPTGCFPARIKTKDSLAVGFTFRNTTLVGHYNFEGKYDAWRSSDLYCVLDTCHVVILY